MTGPLAAYGGVRPPAPDWFTQAIEQRPETSFVAVAGARIAMLTWGERGKPGLLLVHGSSAHAHWWSHIAPFFAEDYRVAAFSLSGCGDSDDREAYTYELFGEELAAVAEAAGLFDGPAKPLVVGHSFGGLIVALATARQPGRFGGGVIVDAYLSEDTRRFKAPPEWRARKLKAYPDLASALARFRVQPPQSCHNDYIADHFARLGLRRQMLEDGSAEGYAWRFDMKVPASMPVVPITPSLARPGCALAFIAGDHSLVTGDHVKNFVMGAVPVGTPWIRIPDAEHHILLDQPLALIAALRGLFASWPAVVSE